MKWYQKLFWVAIVIGFGLLVGGLLFSCADGCAWYISSGAFN